MKIVRGRLFSGDVSNPAYRYNSDCDCVQYSPDGGTTWTDAPNSDPRHAAPFRLPHRTGSDIECNAAANMVAWIKAVIDECTRICGVGGLAIALVNKILDFAEVIFAEEGGILLTLIQAIAGTIFDVGYAALTANFTSDQYDLLQCIFFCNIDGDGQVSADQFAEIQTEVTEQLNEVAGIVVNLFLSLQGEVGLSNAGAQGAATGDCSDCDCGWQACIAGTDLAVAFSIVGTNGTPTGDGIQTATAFVGGDPTRPRTQAYITITLDTCTVTRLQTFFDAPDGFDNECGSGFLTSGYFQNNFANAISVGAGTPTSPFTFEGALTLTDLQVALGVACCDGCSTPPNLATITQVKIRGTGTPPSQLTPYLC